MIALPRGAAARIAAVLLASGCGDGATTAASAESKTSAASTSSSSAAAPGKTTAPSKTADAPAAEPGSIADLRAKAIKIMDALKAGDAKTAGDFCLGGHHDAFVKYVAETIEKKDQSRAKNYAAWSGTLGEIRVDGDRARVAFGDGGRGSVDYLSFNKKDGNWSLFDIPVAQKSEWEKWGSVAP